jgi:metal-responsive CopG/Arc/MetJ family transcriptional regulator
METIQVVIEAGLLRATDRAAQRLEVNRSAFVRDALREHLKRIAVLARERRDSEGYERRPASPDESAAWQKAAAWPDE